MARRTLELKCRTVEQACVDLQRNLIRAVKLLAQGPHREAAVDMAACLRRTEDVVEECLRPPKPAPQPKTIEEDLEPGLDQEEEPVPEDLDEDDATPPGDEG